MAFRSLRGEKTIFGVYIEGRGGVGGRGFWGFLGVREARGDTVSTANGPTPEKVGVWTLGKNHILEERGWGCEVTRGLYETVSPGEW
jgi:hypothetical protein